MEREAHSPNMPLVEVKDMDLRPVVWDATMVTPCGDDVTVVVRVTYRTLEQICLDLWSATQSQITAPSPYRPC